ncbi:centromere protein K-like [Xenia sp. Carnegie-2017]|uniref:centromere protein K-like n=1 Tax=Xenia sp. Carnegie-2017 TaxID=2897299 RepID=UPI001F037AF5|nr:centromere protein K-like [Xenia sp. Carnegie-2017]XP_046839644.1 centromere protein K-like [Xenia sp. Carnegie-2017]XP_046839645.1 centromere protein K-like [Xenia sp. Carnegie-2017]XP_046839646.1 centromere protein K-like [Xenia sp. Carnegie-2017]XP_046839647.1 centromere protein K-like [Xenia sp. Carnegie-2017]
MASSTNCFDLQVGSSDDVDLLKPKQKVKQNLVEECEQMWEHIQDNHHRVASYIKSTPPKGIDRLQAAIKILQLKENRLQAQLKLLKTKDIEVISKDLKFVETCLEEKMKRNVQQLEQVLGVVKEQRVEVAGDLEREKQLLDQQRSINKVLEEKLHMSETVNDEGSHNTVSVSDLQSKKKKASEYYSVIMSHLQKFLAHHFPPPDKEITERNENGRKFCSLQHLIETLMNKLFESPHDCYIKILPSYWPPYIQLLLRSNIILRHSENCDLIRLVSFHA